MTDETNPQLTPPTQDGLPQGANAFLEAHSACYSAVSELFAPYMSHPGVAHKFNQALIKLEEAGQWVNSAINMMLHPELFQLPKQESEDAPPAEG